MAQGNLDPIHVGQYKTKTCVLVNNDSTRGKKVCAMGANGGRLHQLTISSNDTSTRVVNIYRGERLTAQSAMGTGALVDGGAGSDTITRSSGSFVTDGWRVGDIIFVDGPTTIANEFIATLTAVSATTLTFATATVNTAENLPAGAAIYRLGHLNSVSVTTLSGTDGTASNIDGITTKNAGADAAPYRAETLDDYEAIIVQAQVAVTSAKYISFIAKYGEYTSHA